VNQMPGATLFEIEREGETIIFTPVANLSETQEMELVTKEAVEVLNDLSIKNLVMDFYKTDYFGSSAIALFVKLRKIVTGRNGSMVICNLSEHHREILNVTTLDTLWTTCTTRAEAMKAVGN
jgi:anti-anti-sigma factor